MELREINDNNSRIDLVELRDSGNTGIKTPHCKIHGAMLKVSSTGCWRCVQAIDKKSGKCINDCRAGCFYEN